MQVDSKIPFKVEYSICIFISRMNSNKTFVFSVPTRHVQFVSAL